jgi:PAS domain S-box-containing protein
LPALQLYMLAGLVLIGGYFLIPSSLPGVLNFYFATYNLLPVAAILLVIRYRRPSQALAWYFIAGGLSCWSAGEYIWAIYNFIAHEEAPYPSIADFVFQGYYPLIIAGVWTLTRSRFKTWNMGVLLDAALVGCSVGSLGWNFFITPQIQNSNLSPLQVLVSISLPLMDLLLFSLWVFYLLLPVRRTPAYYFFALSLGVTLITDVFYGLALLDGTYHTGHPLTAGWMVAYIFWGATVLHPSRNSLGAPVLAGQPKIGPLRFITLGLVSILGPGMFIVQQASGVEVNLPLMVVTSIILILLVVARMAVMVRRHEAIAKELSIQAHRQAELALFSQAALRTTSLTGLLNDTIDMVYRVLNIEASTILELRSQGNSLIFRRKADPTPTSWQDIPVPHGPDSFSGKILAEKTPVIIEDWNAQTEFKLTPLISENGYLSSLGVPIIERKDTVFGVILAHSVQRNRFTASDVSFLQTVASIVATAIERRRVEDALHQERDFALQVMNNMGQGLVVKNAERIITFVNPAMAEMVGYETGELFGRSMDIFLSPSHLQRVPGILAERNEGITSTYELNLVHKNGRTFCASVVGVPILKNGSLERVILVITDVTERKLAEEEMQKNLAKEKELSELKSRFVTGTSHEFRTPLTAIMTSAELLEHYSQRFSEEKKLEILQRIQTSVKYMTRLLDDILIIGRADAGKLAFNPLPVDLVAECRAALEEVNYQLTPLHQVSFVVQGTPVAAQLDSVLLKHILVNLLSNAIKYSPKGGLILLELVFQPVPGVVCIRLADQGIGILPEDRPRMFEAFHRGKNIGILAGTGLGLSIVKHSVELHNGTIEVTSEPGSGTTMTVVLPLAPALSLPGGAGGESTGEGVQAASFVA